MLIYNIKAMFFSIQGFSTFLMKNIIEDYYSSSARSLKFHHQDIVKTKNSIIDPISTSQ